jgi:hypothetical protein
MATFYSKETQKYDEGQYGCAPGEVTWEYNTTSDILTLKFKEEEMQSYSGPVPTHEFTQLIGNSQAAAMYYALKEWIER